jgi:hypothetical protein
MEVTEKQRCFAIFTPLDTRFYQVLTFADLTDNARHIERDVTRQNFRSAT